MITIIIVSIYLIFSFVFNGIIIRKSGSKYDITDPSLAAMVFFLSPITFPMLFYMFVGDFLVGDE